MMGLVDVLSLEGVLWKEAWGRRLVEGDLLSRLDEVDKDRRRTHAVNS